MNDRAERHRAAQARYAASEKGKATREAYRAEYVRSGRKAGVQSRWARQRADERMADFDSSVEARLGEVLFGRPENNRPGTIAAPRTLRSV